MVVYCKSIKAFKEHGQGYKTYSHNEGISLLKYAVYEECGIIITEADILIGTNGKPFFANDVKKFSISHCDGICVCVLSDFEIGIDCENIRQKSDKVIRRCYSEKENQYIVGCKNPDISFTRLWTLKESYVKMTGDGVGGNLKAVCFDIQNNSVMFDCSCSFFQLSLSDRFIISVCVANKHNKKICSMSVDYNITDEINRFTVDIPI